MKYSFGEARRQRQRGTGCRRDDDGRGVVVLESVLQLKIIYLEERTQRIPHETRLKLSSLCSIRIGPGHAFEKSLYCSGFDPCPEV